MTREQREAIEARLDANSQQVKRLFERHPPERLARRAAEGAWSAAECVEHLNLTAAATLPRIQDAVARARERGLRTASESRIGWLGRILRWGLEPGRFKSRTTASFQPLPGVTPARTLADFLAWQARTIEMLRAAEGLDLSRIRIVSAFNARIRYNVYAAFLLLETHQRRHLDQALRAATHE